MIKYNWIPILGKFDISVDGDIVYHGGEIEFKDSQGQSTIGLAIGRCIANQEFTQGSISAEIEFSNLNDDSTCQIMLGFNPQSDAMTVVGFGNNMLSVESFENRKWNYLGGIGDKNNLKSNTKYLLKVLVEGSRITSKSKQLTPKLL